MTLQANPMRPTYQEAITTLMTKLSIPREEAITKVDLHFARKGWAVETAPIVMAAAPIVVAEPVETPEQIEARVTEAALDALSETVADVAVEAVAETIVEVVAAPAAPVAVAPVAAAPIVKAEKAVKLPKEPKVAAPKAPKAPKEPKQVVWMELPIELHAWVIQHCKDQGTPMTRYIRDLIIADRAGKDAPQA